MIYGSTTKLLHIQTTVTNRIIFYSVHYLPKLAECNNSRNKHLFKEKTLDGGHFMYHLRKFSNYVVW